MHYDKQREQKYIEMGNGVTGHRIKVTDPCREKIVCMLIETLRDTLQVFDFGAAKHPDSGDTPNFLMPEGNKCEWKVRGKSALGHTAKAYADPHAVDEESGLLHILHAIASLSIMYIRHKRNIKHPSDKEE